MESRVEATDFEGFSILDLEFHMKINELTRNQALVFMMQTLRDVMLVQQLQKLPGSIQRAYDFHKKILGFMEACDADGVSRVMREHLEDVDAAPRKEPKEPATRT